MAQSAPPALQDRTTVQQVRFNLNNAGYPAGLNVVHCCYISPQAPQHVCFVLAECTMALLVRVRRALSACDAAAKVPCFLQPLPFGFWDETFVSEFNPIFLLFRGCLSLHLLDINASLVSATYYNNHHRPCQFCVHSFFVSGAVMCFGTPCSSGFYGDAGERRQIRIPFKVF